MAAEIKEALTQYCDVQQEIKDIQDKINDLEKHIGKMEEKGYMVKDSVVGGEGGIQHFPIEGCPWPEYAKKRTLLITRRQQLQDRELKLLELTNRVEEYINQIEDSRMRRMITYRFLDNLTWVQVAYRMGKHHTEESCRKAVERFLQEN